MTGTGTRAHLRLLASFLLAAALAGCGGGGDEGTSGGGSAPPPAVPPPAVPPPPPPAPVPSLALSSSTLSIAGSNVALPDPIIDSSISLTLQNPLSTFWTRIRPTNVPLAAATTTWSSSTEGKLQLTFLPPTSIAAGKYVGSIEVTFCEDEACAKHFAGSPASVAVTYEVSGNRLPLTQIHWSASGAGSAVEFTTAETRTPQQTVRVSVSRLPYAGLYLRRTVPATGLITSVVWGPPTFTTQLGSAYGEYTVSLKAPAALGSGLFADRVEFEACFDPDCTDVVPGSRFTYSPDVLIPATAGVEFSRRSLTTPNGATEVVWSPADQSLYMTASRYAGLGPTGLDPRVLRINPVTLDIGQDVAFPGENLQRMAVTPDGSYLYLGSKTRHFVHRFQLPSLTKDLSISLGDFSPSTPYVVNDFAMVPGAPKSVVVAVSHNRNHGGVYVFDDDVARPDFIGVNPAQTLEHARWLLPTTTPGRFISHNDGPSVPKVNAVEVLALDAQGIRVESSTASTAVMNETIKPELSDGRLFTFDGRIVDAVDGADLGRLDLPDSGTAYALRVNPSTRRIFVWMSVRQRDFVVSYDLDTLEMLALAPVYGGPPFASGLGGSMTLWGDEGVALANGEHLIVLSGAFFSTYRGEPTMNSPSPASHGPRASGFLPAERGR